MTSPTSAVEGCVLGLGIDVIHIDTLVNISKNQSKRVLFAVVEKGIVELLRIISRSYHYRFIILLFHECVVILYCSLLIFTFISLLFC